MHFSYTLLALVFLSACGGSSSSSGPQDPMKDQKGDNPNACLQYYNLEGSELAQKRLSFSKDCSSLNLPESEVIDHIKIKESKNFAAVDCKMVENVLADIAKQKLNLAELEAKKRAEASDKYNKAILGIEKQIERNIGKPELSEVIASVSLYPVKRHSVMDVISQMQAKGLSYTFDEIDSSQRKLIMKSFVSSRFDYPVEEEMMFSISNIHYCSLKSNRFKEESFLEYQGNFLGKSFTEVYSANIY